jgi:hypothetical protein
MSPFVIAFAMLAVFEAIGITLALALCKAAAQRPIYGPPLGQEEDA